VRYELKFSEDAREQLRALPKAIRQRIGLNLTRMQADLSGDVSRESMYRLRVGSYRVLFRLEGKAIVVYAVKDRKDAYA
jgi:mRNA interferase RelE/StbE